MKKHTCFPMICLVYIFALLTAGFALAGPGHAGESISPPKMRGDLAVKLKIPLFNPSFSETPIARVGAKPILLKELTPSLQASDSILFWEFKTSGWELTKQFKKALADRILQNQGEPGQVEIFANERISEEQSLTLEAPLFSGLFTDVPVAMVNEVPVTVADFSQDLQSAHSEATGGASKSGALDNTQRLMERLITTRLIEQEARNIGFDQTSSFRKQVDAHAEKILLYALLDKQSEGLEPDLDAVNELYRKVSLEGLFRSLHFAQEDEAKVLRAAYEKKGHFDALADDAVAKGQAVEEAQTGFIKFNKLLPKIATEASGMKVGEVSQVFRKGKGFVLFKLIDRRFIEDPQALQFAQKNVWERQKTEQGVAFIRKTIDHYSEFNKAALEDLDFTKTSQANPKIQLGEALKPLLKDERTLVRVEGANPEILSVADMAEKIRETYFHGVDTVLNPKEVDLKKNEIMDDALFRMAGTIEAKKLGLDQRPEYLREVVEFERQTLFDIFMYKVVTPEVRPSEEEMRKYYADHQDEYMTPTMLKIRSLAFHHEKDALNAVGKLRSGSDFKWVSSNVEGLVDFEDKDLMEFDNKVLSHTALPAELQSEAITSQRGGVLLYGKPESYYYVLYLQDVFPAEPRPYDQVRKDVIKVVYQQAVEKTLDSWVEKLKEAYDVVVFLEK